MTATPFSRLRNGAIAGVAALALATATAVPAQALDKTDRAFLGGAATALIIGGLIAQAQKNRAPAYRYEEPRHYSPGYRQDDGYGYGYPPPRHRPAPAYVPAPHYHDSAVAAGFAEYSHASKRAIQQRLRAYGYYRGAIDGAFGSGTRRAIEAYARDSGSAALLNTRNGVVSLLNSLLA